jgi:hypothetical protein
MKIMRLVVLVVLLSGTFAIAQTVVAPPPKPRGVMAEANADILKLLQAKLSESVILNKIHATKTPFDTSADAILMLKKAGANDNEINAILTSGTDAAASSAAPNQPAAPAPQGPTLEETLNFIVQQLTQQGSLTFTLYYAGLGSAQAIAYSNIHPDPAKCALSWTEQTRSGTNSGDLAAINSSSNFILDLKHLKSVQVQSLQDKDNQADANVSIVPPVFIAVFNTDDRSRLYFGDANRADRVAQALSHAAELCGASKDPF